MCNGNGLRFAIWRLQTRAAFFGVLHQSVKLKQKRLRFDIKIRKINNLLLILEHYKKRCYNKVTPFSDVNPFAIPLRCHSFLEVAYLFYNVLITSSDHGGGKL